MNSYLTLTPHHKLLLPNPLERTRTLLVGANGVLRQHALLLRCLRRAQELQLPELCALASEALALRSIGVMCSVGV